MRCQSQDQGRRSCQARGGQLWRLLGYQSLGGGVFQLPCQVDHEIQGRGGDDGGGKDPDLEDWSDYEAIDKDDDDGNDENENDDSDVKGGGVLSPWGRASSPS